jgi:hypothetical protein
VDACEIVKKIKVRMFVTERDGHATNHGAAHAVAPAGSVEQGFQGEAS